MTNVYNLGCDRQNLTDIDKEKKTRSPKDANKRRLTWSERQLGKKTVTNSTRSGSYSAQLDKCRVNLRHKNE